MEAIRHDPRRALDANPLTLSLPVVVNARNRADIIVLHFSHPARCLLTPTDREPETEKIVSVPSLLRCNVSRGRMLPRLWTL